MQSSSPSLMLVLHQNLSLPPFPPLFHIQSAVCHSETSPLSLSRSHIGLQAAVRSAAEAAATAAVPVLSLQSLTHTHILSDVEQETSLPEGDPVLRPSVRSPPLTNGSTTRRSKRLHSTSRRTEPPIDGCIMCVHLRSSSHPLRPAVLVLES